MRFSLALSAADLCILLVNFITLEHGPVVHKLGKILIDELSERLDEGARQASGRDHELDLGAIFPDDLPFAVVQLEDISEQIESEEIKNFLESIITELRTEQMSRKS